METKSCERCGRAFARPSSFSNQTWAKQRYCTLLCANRTRAERRRTRGSETKPCEQCGGEMVWPRNYSAKQWASKRYCDRRCAGVAMRAATDVRRPLRRCAICGDEYRSRYQNQKTCKRSECKAEYRRTVTGPASSERIKADFAAGRRKKSAGISAREVALWAILRQHGWVWRLRWIEDAFEFELDFAHRELMLNVEIDGIEHRWTKGLERDTDRDALLAAQGWQILRIPNEDVDADAQAVADRVLAWARDSRV